MTVSACGVVEFKDGYWRRLIVACGCIVIGSEIG